MDLFPTFAKIAGGKVPDDRVIDGVDQADFLPGKQEKSTREGLIVYLGNDVWDVKWRNWKAYLKEQDNILSANRNAGMPHIYNLLKDPGESQNVILPADLGSQGRRFRLTDVDGHVVKPVLA